MIQPLTTTPPGYEWTCPNCGEHVTSWTKPPDLAQPAPPAESDDALRLLIELTSHVDLVLAMQRSSSDVELHDRFKRLAAAAAEARRYLAATEEGTS